MLSGENTDKIAGKTIFNLMSMYRITDIRSKPIEHNVSTTEETIIQNLKNMHYEDTKREPTRSSVRNRYDIKPKQLVFFIDLFCFHTIHKHKTTKNHHNY